MGILSKIKSAIFGDKGPLGGSVFGSGQKTAPQPTSLQPTSPGLTNKPAMPQMQPGQQPQAQQQQQPVDVEAVLQGIEAKKGGAKLNWRTSIVDLMKLLDLDSSLDNRRELATELGYSGEKNGSAEMNIWLHKALMRELERSGGKVPASLKD